MNSLKSNMVLMMMILVGILTVEETRAQGTECASKLAPCANFLSSTKPPESCCKPLREAVLKQKKCLCDLYKDPNLLPSLGINVTQALLFPKYCGVSSDTSSCSKVSAPAPSTSLTPPPPGVPGNKGSSSKIAWTGLSSLLIFWASVMAY